MCGFYVRMRVRCIGILAKYVIVSFRLRVTDCMGILMGLCYPSFMQHSTW